MEERLSEGLCGFLDLAHIYENQDVEFFADKGVEKGIARTFVGDIKKWVKEVPG